MRRVGFSGGMTIEEHLEAGLREIVENQLPHFADHTKQDIIDRILKKTDSNGNKLYKNLNSVFKGFPEDQKTLIREFVSKGPELLSGIVFPIEEAIHDFAVELLRGMQSAYILDNNKELERLQNELQSAIENIVNYAGPGSDEAQTILAKQLKKVKHHDNINTVVEGVVFEYEGQLYKFTGNFAPINQILGLFKYGRGDVPPIRSTEERSERLPEQSGGENWNKIVENVSSFALVPGGFKPPHRGHLEMVENYRQADHVFILMSGPAKSRPRSIKGKPITFELASQVWDLFLKDAGIANYSIVRAGDEHGGTPVRLAYEMLGSALPEQTVYMVCGDKGDDPARYSRAAAPEDVNLVMTPCGVVKHSESGEDLSGTFLRKYVESGNIEEFREYIPATSKHRTEEIFQMLGGERQLKESMPDTIFRLVEEALNEKTKVSKAGQGRVSKKIAHMIGDEGKDEDQAAAIAYSMEERRELDEISVSGGAPGGGPSSIEGSPGVSRKRRRLEPGWEELEEDELDPKPTKRKRSVIMKEKDLTEAVYEFLTNSGTI
jgi:hypothetical protein